MKENKQIDIPDKQPPVSINLRQLPGYCRNVLGSPYTHTVLLLSCLAVMVFLFFSLGRLPEKPVHNTKNPAETEKPDIMERQELIERLESIESRLTEQAEKAEKNMAAVINSSGQTLKEIRTLNSVYLGLLDAQKRRTVESLYKEETLAIEKKEAAEAFREGRYVTAARLYGVIAEAHKDDEESRFYQYYSLFLINKMDKDNYRLIGDAFALLERNGYTRKEITDTLKFITEETGKVEEKP